MERPSNPKYRKSQRKSRDTKNLQTRTHRLSFGCYGLKALEGMNMKASQMEAFRRVLVRRTRKFGRVFIRTFPYKPVSGKPTKIRMGKGKGSVQFWVCPVKPGQILFEVAGAIPADAFQELLKKASKKLPMRTKFITYNSASLDKPPATGTPFWSQHFGDTLQESLFSFKSVPSPREGLASEQQNKAEQ